MRRFEFTEGSAKKFWEIELQDTGFTVRWGRIGTHGQSQQKSFSNALKAQAEHDKLIAEKQKKGYAEVGGATHTGGAAPPATAPTPPAEPAEVEEQTPPANSQQPIFWSDSLVRRVHPRRGGMDVPVRPLTAPMVAWASVKEDFRKFVMTEGEPSARKGEFVAHTAAAASRLSRGEPSVGTPEEDAVLLTFLQHASRWNDRPDVEPAIDLLFSVGGPAHATRAMLLSLGMELEGSSPAWVVRSREKPPGYSSLSTGKLLGLPRLRALLATQADDAGYAAARDAAAALMTELTDDPRAGAAFLFPTEGAWARDEAQAFAKAHTWRGALFLCSLSDRDPLGLVAPRVHGASLLGGSPRQDYLPTLLEGVGVDALVLLRSLAAQQYSFAEGRRTWAELVSAINADEAMELLCEHLGEKEVPPFVLEMALRWPARALRVLVPRATQRGKAADAPRAVLTTFVRRATDAVQAELPALSEEARRFVSSLQVVSAGSDVPDARPDQLPPVLASPPWLAAEQPPSLPVLEEVTPPELPDTLVWSPGEREAWSHEQGWEDSAHRYSTYTPEQWQEAGKLPPGTERLPPSFFVFAPEDLALQHIASFKPWSRGEEAWFPAIAAHLGLAASPPLLTYITARKGELYRVLLPFGVSRIAPQVAEAFVGSKKARPHARAWFLRHPQHATAGLLPVALGKPGKAKDAACAALRLLATSGHAAAVLELAGRVSQQVREATARVIAFDPLQLFPREREPLPDFFSPVALTRPLLADRSARLSLSSVEALGTMLSFSSLEEPYAGLEQVKAACEPESLARFAWDLFEAWMVAGAPGKEVWAFQALGHFGDDGCARRLAPLIRQWPGESAHARAATGLDVLATLGTDVTLIYLNGIAEQVKFKGLQERAREKIAQIAEARGLTGDELADRLAPDLGLDENGSLSLDFGERTFTVGFDEQLKPFVKDASGARLKELPRPTKKDDAEKAHAAEERWKTLKKDAKTAASTQVLRLELAMCARRRWSVETFRQFFVAHPLLIHVVRRLVWGRYTGDGKLTATFRVAEDRTFADLEGDPWTLPEDARVGLPHALEFDEKTAGAWGRILANRQLPQPFPQMGRPTYAPTAEEREGTELVRVKGLKLPTGKVLGLETRGWRRGPSSDGGWVPTMEKDLGPDRRVVLRLDPGLLTGELSKSPEQTLGAVVMRKPNTWEKRDLLPFGALDPILFSEVVRDLEGLRAVQAHADEEQRS